MLRGGKRALVPFAAILMASTIFLSGSRGGMLSFVVEIMFFAALTLMQRRNPRVALGLIAVCILVLAFLVFVGKGQVLGRLGDLGPGIRWNMTKDSFRMFSHRPLLGWGLGTFPTVYPAYRSFYTNLFVNEAHNDYAQLLVETGLLGFATMLWFLARLYQQGLPTDLPPLGIKMGWSSLSRGFAGMYRYSVSQLRGFQFANPGECCAVLCALQVGRFSVG
jgi:O-antigen ligase